jgi:phosphatidylglycerol:prolipoprotein diacylglycerol transferase
MAFNPAYMLVMASAVVVGYLLIRRSQRDLPLAWWERLGLAFGAFVGAMLGAKLPFVLTDWEGLASGKAWLSDGKTILYGLTGGYLGVEVAKWALEIRTKTGDTYAVPVAVAVAIGRLGCFVAGCCHGKPTAMPWGVDFGDGPRHPTQLYEVGFHLACAALLLCIHRRGWFRYQQFKLYLLLYMAYRFATEWLRPEPVLAWGLTFYQWTILPLAPIVLLLWWYDQVRYARPEAVGSGVALEPGLAGAAGAVSAANPTQAAKSD